MGCFFVFTSATLGGQKTAVSLEPPTVHEQNPPKKKTGNLPTTAKLLVVLFESKVLHTKNERKEAPTPI